MLRYAPRQRFVLASYALEEEEASNLGVPLFYTEIINGSEAF